MKKEIKKLVNQISRDVLVYYVLSCLLGKACR